MNICKVCQKNIANHRKYCSNKCYNIGRLGNKRPDVVLRNKTNNPVWDKTSRDKMANSLRGRKQAPEVVARRSMSIKKLYQDNPEMAAKQVKALHEKYTSKIPPGWRRMRLLALDRDKYTCQNCFDESKRVIVHHKDHMGRNLPSQKDMNNEISNLITLCYGCHISIHTWTVRRGRPPRQL